MSLARLTVNIVGQMLTDARYVMMGMDSIVVIVLNVPILIV